MISIIMDEERTKLLDSLHHAGRTTHSIYRQLKTDGIKGERGCSTSCPIGEYLISKGHDGPEVHSRHVSVSTDYGDVIVETPVTIKQFIINFDDGKYLDIVRKE